jgi:arabinogalactan endo-1,4-beta-galactosidase
VPEGEGLGIFYWEPEVCSEVLPDAYPLGASRLAKNYTLQLTEALSAYKDA